MGIGFTIKSPLFPLFAIFLSSLYWFIEGMMRHQYWYKYVLRFRTLREYINKKPPEIENLSLYDLTNHFMKNHRTESKRFKKSFFKLEPTVVYGSMGLCAAIIWWFLRNGIIKFV